jgi:mxaJ protein
VTGRRRIARRWLVLATLAPLSALAARPGPATPPAVLRVCADPNNLPFSNERQEGFENRIARLIARDMGAELRYTWWAQRRGFVRNTLGAGRCDLIPGVPAGFEPVATTAPYYRSTYVFVTRRADGPPITSFDDTRLRRLKVGVHLIGDDYANPPPVEALARRGIVRNVIGYTLYGDYRRPNPPARLVEAVADGTVDVAIVWGPLGGYFAGRAAGLRVTPVQDAAAAAGVPFVFAIAMGVRPGDTSLARRLDAVLTRRRAEIARVLDEFGIPRVPAATAEGL